MRLVKFNTARERGMYILKTAWRSKMREPYSMKITFEKAPDYEATTSLEMDDSGKIGTVIEGMAEIAWANGWRPRGLGNFLTQVIQGYKIPEEKK